MENKIMKKMIIVLFTLIIANITLADTINVPDDYATIQGAINASVNADSIIVQNGVYNENINFNGKLIVLTSLFAYTGNEEDIVNTIIDGSNSRTVKFVSSETNEAQIIGFTVQNGYSDYFGGGIYCYNASSPIISYCHIRDNYGEYGGGISCLEDSNALIENCLFDGNSGYTGGAFYSLGSTPEINNCIFQNNEASHSGGAMSLRTSSFNISNCLIINNEASVVGGGVYTGYDSSPVLTNITFYGNNALGGASWYGGALIANEIYSYPILRNCLSWNNYPEEIAHGQGQAAAYYSDIRDGSLSQWAYYFLEGCIDIDPMMTDPENGDFSLLEGSPCIDSGDPNSPLDPDGTRADMGYLFHDQGNGIGDNYELQITNYELKQNYPNPFNPVTKINYELGGTLVTSGSTNYETAEIIVHNSVGQIVGVYPCSFTNNNHGSVQFDGSKFNSGLYYYSLVVDGKKMETKSMILIK